MEEIKIKKQVKELQDIIASNDPAKQSESIQLFRQLLSGKTHLPSHSFRFSLILLFFPIGVDAILSIQPVIDFDIVSCVIYFLRMDDNADVQLQAARAITNITLSNTSEHISYVVEAGAIPILIRLLSSPNEEIRATVAWAVANIAGNRIEYRDMMITEGVLPALLQAVEGFKEKSKHTVLRFPHEDVNEQAVLIIGNTVVDDLIERDGFYLKQS